MIFVFIMSCDGKKHLTEVKNDDIKMVMILKNNQQFNLHQFLFKGNQLPIVDQFFAFIGNGNNNIG